MYDFHKDKQRYFNWQYETARDWVIPFISADREIPKDAKVLEIGCAEAGVLKAFLDQGYNCTGIELSDSRATLAKQFLAENISRGEAEILSRDIYDIDPKKDNMFQYDIIILKDVIEHIFDQDKFMYHVQNFLKPGGRIFFGFPPWHMPFGGHQQICKSGFLGKLPYCHLLPAFMYKGLLKLFGEKEATIKELLEIKETGITIGRFKKIVANNNYKINASKFFLVNPIYEKKFGLKPRTQLGLIAALPFINNFLTTAVYFVIEKN